MLATLLPQNLEMKMKCLILVALALLVSFTAPPANAVVCFDERVTKAIERAAGRMPNPRECNLATYRVPPGHSEFDLAVREALHILEKKPAAPTTKRSPRFIQNVWNPRWSNLRYFLKCQIRCEAIALLQVSMYDESALRNNVFLESHLPSANRTS